MKTLITIIILCITSSAIAQTPSYVPTNGLIGWWPFNGNANDESGNGNNGTVNGATLTTDRNNISNAAYSFDGNNVLIPLNQTIVNMPSRTISLWFNSSTPQSGGRLFETTSYSWGIGCYNSTQFGCWYQKSNKAYNAVNLNFGGHNTWHNLVYVCDSVSGNVKVYLNGVNVHSSIAVSNPGNPIAWLNHFIKVGQGNANESFIGKIDDIALWNRSLTPTEITNLYNSINTPAPIVSVSPSSTTICPGTPTTLTASTSGSTACSSSGLPTSLQTGLVGYWPFCGNANDASGNGNNGTVNGATLTTDRFGNSGSAYSFDGNDWIEMIVPSLPISNNQRSVSVWTNVLNANPTNKTAMHYGNNTFNNRFALLYTNSNNLAIIGESNDACHNCTGTVNYSSSIATPGVWQHIVVNFNGNIVSVYIDGVLSYDAPKNFNTILSALRIGKSIDSHLSGEYFSGKIDDIAIWNRALTAAEIQQLYTTTTSNATYSWSPGGATTPSITVSPTTTTTYTVTATANGQSSTSTAVVTVTTPPTITASSSTICAGQSATLTAAAAGSSTTSPCSGLTGSLSSGLVGYWPFCGNANDFSGNGYHLNVIGDASLTTGHTNIANSAYQFSTVTNNSRLEFNTNNYNIIDNLVQGTMSFWVKINAQEASNHYFGFDNMFSVRQKHGLNTQLLIGLKSGTMKLRLHLDGALPSSGDLESNSSLNLGIWYHVTYTWDGQFEKVFINGVLDNQINSTTSITTMSSPNMFCFGSYDGMGSTSTHSNLDDIGIWNRALTTAEIQQLYTQGQTTYSWSPGGATTPSITVSPTSTTTYTCSVTTNGTTCSSDQVITVNAIPTVNAGLDQSVCMGSNVMLSATGATTYAWSGGVQNGVAFAPTISGTYTVTGTSNGCSATDLVQVSVMPAAVVSSNPAAICIGQSSTLTATLNGASSPCSSLSGSLSTGLVGYWPFCGNANDVSGNGNNGTVNGATLTTDRFGNASSAYSFDGVNDYIDASVSNVPLLNSARTISLWMNFTPLSNDWNGLVSYGDGIGTANADKLYDLFIKNNTQQFYINNNELGNVSGTLSNTIGNWCNLIISYNGTNINNGYQLYINGVNQSLTPFNYTSLTSLATTISNVFFGRTSMSYSGQNFYYSGNLDDIGIWNRALTTAEIQQLYTLGQTTYSWSPGGATTPSITVSPTNTTTYTYTATTNGVSCPASATVTVNPLPTANAGADFTKTCVTNPSGTLVGMTSVAGHTYAWTPATGLSSAGSANPTANPAATTTYTLTTTNTASGCTATDQVLVTVNTTLPTANAGVDFTKTCVTNPSGTLVGMTSVAGNTYAWTPATGLSSAGSANPTANPTATTTYTLTATNTSSGCTATDQVLVTVNTALPTANAGADFTKTCVTNPSGTLVGMTSVAGNTYAWTPATGLSSAGSANPTANPTATTTYTLTATNTASGCTATDQVLVTVNTALPTVNAGLDQTICQGVSTVLNASSNGTSLSWNNGVQNNIGFVPSTVGTTTYTATATGSNGCTANDNVVITVNPLPSATVTTNGTSSFCPGSSVQLCAPTGTGYSYLWSGNLGTTQCVTISSSATTSVTVTNAFNCSATSAPQQVTVFNNPLASAGLDATITCVQNASGAQIGDVPNPTYTYSWTPATGLNSATIGNPIANPSTTTTYTLTVVNADGCMGSDQVTVTVNNTPPTANAGLDQSICLGASLVLQGSTNGASGTWNNGVTNGIPFTPSQSGTTSYTYSTVGANGCVNNDQVIVTVNALPVANAGQGAVITCVQNVNGVQLGANPISGNTYAWTPTSGLNNTSTANPTATPNASTTYTLLMSDANGCSDTAQVVVTVNNNPPIVSAGNDANVCNGDSLYLFANTTVGSTVVWNGTIQNGSNILPAQSGYQVATATAANGCTAQDSLLVNLLQPTTSTLNEVACDEFVLNGNVYLQTGTYTQLLTNAAGCDSTITLNLTINLSPATPVVYVQNEVNLSTDVVPGQTYQWIYCSDLIPVPGATNPTFNPAANAIYAVVVTNNCGSDTSSCTAVSTIGLADHAQTSILVYPNPGNDQIHIQINEALLNTNYEIYDLNGRVLQRGIFNQILNDLYLGNFARGVYTLRTISQYPIQIIKQ
jgi:hypothetical protein